MIFLSWGGRPALVESNSSLVGLVLKDGSWEEDNAVEILDDGRRLSERVFVASFGAIGAGLPDLPLETAALSPEPEETPTERR